MPTSHTKDSSLGCLDSPGGPSRVPLARHYNATTNDYLLDTSTTPPSGYAYQATLGYVRLEGSLPGGGVTTYTRNALGQVTQVTTPTITYTYAYDPAHRLQSVTDSRGTKRLTYTYSSGGHLTSMRDSDGGTTSYGYDPVGRLTGIWAPNGESVTFAHDAGGRLTEKTFPNGVTSRYAWNADNTLAQLITQLGATILSQHDYTYDGVGNRHIIGDVVAFLNLLWSDVLHRPACRALPSAACRSLGRHLLPPATRTGARTCLRELPPRAFPPPQRGASACDRPAGAGSEIPLLSDGGVVPRAGRGGRESFLTLIGVDPVS